MNSASNELHEQCEKTTRDPLTETEQLQTRVLDRLLV